MPPLRRDRSALTVIDVQTRLAAAMPDMGLVCANIGLLMRAASRLGLPQWASEQNPNGIGPTVPELRGLAPPGAVLVKNRFSFFDQPEFAAALRESGRSEIIVCGLEAHVCVLQTAFGLKSAGFRVAVVADAVTSRHAIDKTVALERLRGAGIDVVTAEMVVFEWLGAPSDPAFRDLLPLIRDRLKS